MTDSQVFNWLQHSFTRHTGGNVEIRDWYYETCPISGMNVAIIIIATVDGMPTKARYANKEWLIQGDANSFTHSTPVPTNSGYNRK